MTEPLYDALAAMHGLTPRHQLREDRMPMDPISFDVQTTATPRAAELPAEPHPDPTVYGLPPEHVYASDDDLTGPPSPPLGAPAAEPGVALVRCACGEQIVQVRGG